MMGFVHSGTAMLMRAKRLVQIVNTNGLRKSSIVFSTCNNPWPGYENMSYQTLQFLKTGFLQKNHFHRCHLQIFSVLFHNNKNKIYFSLSFEKKN